MQNEHRAAIRAEASRLEQAFIDAGALRIEADSLLPADTLLDLYGEDIRARAYVTNDPVLGERVMRPDFTVPIVERHMAEGAEPARYTYNGAVWRKQEAGSMRDTEFVQVGFELFDRLDPANSDAEVFSLFSNILPSTLNVLVGDYGILRAAVLGLKTSPRKKEALMRHLWRPARFENLIMRFGGQRELPIGRAEILQSLTTTAPKDLMKNAGDAIGLRSNSEVLERLEDLKMDATEPDISKEEIELIDLLFGLDVTVENAVKQLRDLSNSHACIAKAATAFEVRADALVAKGVDISTLNFVGNYGRTSMEYYDGFVFGFSDGETVVASGGRYDALTILLGDGRAIPAVGGVIRPDALIGARV